MEHRVVYPGLCILCCIFGLCNVSVGATPQRIKETHMSNEPEEGTLLAKTRDRLVRSDKSYLQIFRDTGLTPNWLSMLAQGKIAEPSVNKIQKLNEYLTGRPLEV